MSHSKLRAKRARFTFCQKLIKMPKTVNLATFETCGQKVLPDRPILIRQKMVEKNSNETFLVIFKQCVDPLWAKIVENILGN